MPAEGWVLLLAVVALLEGWVIYLLATQARWEREGRLAWKRRYFHPESDELESTD